MSLIRIKNPIPSVNSVNRLTASARITNAQKLTPGFGVQVKYEIGREKAKVCLY